MRILHIDEQTEWRGGEQQASWLIRGIAASGHDQWIVGRPDSPFLTNPHGGVELNRVAFPLRAELDLPSAVRLARLCAREKIDIIHAHSSHAHGLALMARTLLGRRGPKLVASRRVSFPPKGHYLNRWKYSMPDRVLCVSFAVEKVLRKYGVPEDRLAVVHSAVDFERVNVDPLPRSEIGVPEHVPLIVNAGALVDHKDHATLLEAMAKVRKNMPDVWLAIAGAGPLRAVLEKKALALGIKEHTVFLGHRHDAPRLIRTGNVYVSSSISEGLGTSILEALASGTPVVATRAGGADEMVIPGHTGWLVHRRNSDSLATAILECMHNREAALKMAAEGRRLVEHEFTAAQMVERTLLVYAELMED